MARLPIYKAALDMTVHFEKLAAGFSRYHKYTLGTELREGSRRVLMHGLCPPWARPLGLSPVMAAVTLSMLAPMEHIAA